MADTNGDFESLSALDKLVSDKTSEDATGETNSLEENAQKPLNDSNLSIDDHSLDNGFPNSSLGEYDLHLSETSAGLNNTSDCDNLEKENIPVRSEYENKDISINTNSTSEDSQMVVERDMENFSLQLGEDSELEDRGENGETTLSALTTDESDFLNRIPNPENTLPTDAINNNEDKSMDFMNIQSDVNMDINSVSTDEINPTLSELSTNDKPGSNTQDANDDAVESFDMSTGVPADEERITEHTSNTENINDASEPDMNNLLEPESLENNSISESQPMEAESLQEKEHNESDNLSHAEAEETLEPEKLLSNSLAQDNIEESELESEVMQTEGALQPDAFQTDHLESEKHQEDSLTMQKSHLDSLEHNQTIESEVLRSETLSNDAHEPDPMDNETLQSNTMESDALQSESLEDINMNSSDIHKENEIQDSTSSFVDQSTDANAVSEALPVERESTVSASGQLEESDESNMARESPQLPTPSSGSLPTAPTPPIVQTSAANSEGVTSGSECNSDNSTGEGKVTVGQGDVTVGDFNWDSVKCVYCDALVIDQEPKLLPCLHSACHKCVSHEAAQPAMKDEDIVPSK